MSKGIYIGVDDVARKVSKVYIGVDGIARKVLKSYIGDENGIARQFYSAEKFHWWKQYDVNAWESVAGGYGHSEGYDAGEFTTPSSGSILYATINFNASTGMFTFNDVRNVTFEFDYTDGISTWYKLANNCINTYAANPTWQSNTAARQMLKIIGGTGVLNDAVGAYILDTNPYQYAKPTGHAASYTLIKGASASYPPGKDGSDSNDSGYWYYQYTSDGSNTYRSYDGYYWVYDGYHE